ncbi:hypothetical protein T4B_11567 [Trichinella pseudospiralis]|uniref:Uncharacterized protein n=2 Tax=Trichinella pseudospiralis TaxID=6337 RepID=A0A0V1G6I8_TRIPS|nr:hypothetical protein T4D_876 [Trichinella pseudospiralis]KRZ34335.1 hypothetical protein T4B_11567 [Trichinella pseudospiralis]
MTMTILYDVVGKQQLMSKEEDREAVVREEEDIPAYIPGRQKEWKPEPPLPNNACRKHTSVGKAMTVAGSGQCLPMSSRLIQFFRKQTSCCR